MSAGFTFIQLSVLLMVASLTLVACLPPLPCTSVSSGITTMRMNTILSALRQFEVSNGRLPCPADATQPTGSTLYGAEAANGGASGNCTGGSPAANAIDATNHVATGMLPVRALGLSTSYALDAWGRTLTYAVDTSATSCFEGTLNGALTVTDNGVSANSVVALVSYGPDGHGAWTPQTGASLSAMRLNSYATDSDELTNAHLDASFTPALPLTNYIRKLPSKTFGNLVTYKSPLWNLNTTPSAASTIFPTITMPTNATYITGETLTFVLNYPQTVTIAGSPQLMLTIGSQTRYAAYISGSGTNLITFTYTVQSGDYAPSGIGVASQVATTHGTINYACNSFLLPNTSGITVKNLYLYVTDAVNGRVEEFDAYGNYLNKFGSPGSGNGQFLTSKQPAVDAAGNVWVTDSVNARVEEFTQGGTYMSQFGSLGLLNGQFTTAGALAIDSSGNFWVADVGGGRVEKFSSSGAYLAKFGSLGVLNGQFAVPTGIAIDSAGNLWVGDFGNSRMEKFSSSGAYLGKFGSLGSGNGQFINPCGHALDASGNLWVVDNGNNRVQKFDASGNYLGQFGSFGTTSGKFFGPCGIAIDAAGNLWVNDSGNNRIQEFTAGGAFLNKFGSFGSGNGQFATPAGIGLAYY